MNGTNVIMRVSIRFQRVCKAIAEKYQISLPAATEVILDEFSKGGMIIYGRKFTIDTVIEKVTREIKNENKAETQDTPVATKRQEAVTQGEKVVTKTDTGANA
jgi:hypothetical protein